MFLKFRLTFLKIFEPFEESYQGYIYVSTNRAILHTYSLKVYHHMQKWFSL